MELLQVAELLRKVPMFSRLDGAKVKLLAFTSEVLTFEDGDTLFLAGESADAAYVLIEGTVDVLAQTAAGAVVATSLGRNELCGEMGVLSKGTRSATIRARGKVQALRISAETFLRVLAENPEVALDVMGQLSEKLVRSLRQYEALHDELERRRASEGGAEALP